VADRGLGNAATQRITRRSGELLAAIQPEVSVLEGGSQYDIPYNQRPLAYVALFSAG